MRLCTVLVFMCVVTSSLCQRLEQEECDADRKMVDVNFNNADVLLGGIFNLRSGGTNGYGCGAPLSEDMLSYEAARWAIGKINSDNYINGIRMGMRAYDVCRSPDRAIAAVNDFYPQYSTSSMYCNATNKYNLGILGAYTSQTTAPIAELTGKFPASMISPYAGAPELSDKTRFPYFMRTGMSATEQVRAMMEAMKALGWERIVLVFADNYYGTSTMNEMVRQSQMGDVCVVLSVGLPENGNIGDYLEKLQDIGTYDVNGAVIFADHETTMTALDAVDQVPGAGNIQWMLSEINMNAQIFPRKVRGSVFVQPEFTEVSEFFNYFTNINENTPPVENPWYRDWFMSLFQCRLQGVNYAPYSSLSDCTTKTAAQKRLAINTRYAAVDSTIKAVYAYAKALKTAHAQTCGNAAGMCLGLRQMTPQQFHNYLSDVNLDLNEVNINSLRGLRVKFDANGDFYTLGHTYWNYNNQPSGPFAHKNVGSFINNVLDLPASEVFMYNADRSSVLPSLPTSTCPKAGCRNCVVHRPMVHFTYAPGDIVLGGLFDIHAQGQEVLTCGALKPTHALNVAAFRYAIKQVKQVFPGILNGVELGSLIVDLCDNGETGRLLMNNLLGGRHIVANVDPNLVKTVVGELDSTEAISMASMLGHFDMPYIESSATSTYLLDKSLFPTFSRAIPSDYQQMLAIVLMLKKLDWNYVQVVYSGDAYGSSGYQLIKSEGAKRSICVAASHEIGRDGNIDTIVNKLNEKPDARVVVAIVDTDEYRMLLKEIQDQGLQGKFVLIGTETWGRRMSVVNGYEAVAEGSITLDITQPQISQFRNWLSTLNPTDPATMKEMPFLTEWYQYAFSCYLDASNRGMYTNECNPNLPITQAPRYQESSYIPFMIAATYAAARAVDETIRDYCGDGTRNYNGLCWQFRSSDDAKNKILEYLKSSEYLLNGYQFKMKNGEGLSNFEFYSFTAGQYVRIGAFDTEEAKLQLDFANPISLPPAFTSSCTTRCSECVYLVQSDPFLRINGDADLQLGMSFALKNPGLDPFLCGDLRLTNGIQSALAVMYALEMVNSGNGPVLLNNVKVGGLVIDHCNSPARAYGIPSALYSGIVGNTEPRPNLNAIRGWLTDNTMVTEEMKDFFSDLNLPVISPMATTNRFLDDEEYPTFLRTIQGDSTIANALAVLTKSLGLQYVSVLYSANSFGREGMNAFKSVAMQEGLCIITTVEMDTGDIDNIVDDLISQPTHVVITYLGYEDMDTFLTARGRNSNGQSLVVISPEPYPLVFNTRGMDAKNVLALRMKTNTLEHFRDYLSSFSLNPDSYTDDHPYWRAYYMNMFQCNLPGEYRYSSDCGPLRNITTTSSFYMDNYVLPTINAVFTFVQAAHETLEIQCGENYISVCAKFHSDPNTNTILLQKMKGANFFDPSGTTFSFIGKEGNTGREIVLFDGTQMRKVADFAGASINIMDRTFRQIFDTTKSSCISPCSECINNNMNFTYIPGDVLLGGIFDVHEAALTPFSCGEINTIHGFQLLEAFHFAIDKVNDKSGQFADVLKNVKLGGIGLDACESAVKGGYLVSNIHNGLSVLERDGHTIDPDNIEAYIATYSSDRSIYLARLLKTLKIPQISYGSSSITLLDQDSYPYFLRTVPADDRQAMGMMKFLRNYDIRYVQVVHTADNYGEQGAKIFNTLAEEQKVCIAQTVSYLAQSSVTVENANDVVLALLKKPVANTVIVFADITYINELLQAIRRNPDAHGKFKFVGSETWANNPEAIEGVEDIALSSVTLDLDVVDIRDFDEYLSTKTPANYPENPWFPEFYEEIHNCYLTIPDTKYPGRCPNAPKNIVTSRRYKQDTSLIHVINAVYSAAYGLDLALREECGDEYTTVCEAFKNRENRREFVFEKMKESSFVDLSGQQFSFSDRGDGNKGYVLYSIDSSNVLGYTYNPIAKYSSAGELSVTRSAYKPSWDGSCERRDSCTECPTIRNLRTRFMLPEHQNTGSNPATLIYAARIHDQGQDAYRCGPMNIYYTLQALAAVYTLQHSNLITDKPFDLRPLILDHCNNELRIDQDVFNLLTTGNLCNAEFDSDGSVIDASTVMGVQVQSSRYVVAANRVTAPLKIQLMSGSASSTALSDKWRYPYFARTVSPDNIQMEVIAKILEDNDWTYVGVVYSKESYGINGYKNLQALMNEGKYSCIGIAEGIDNPSEMSEMRQVVKRIGETEGVGVIVLITLDPRSFLEAIIAEGVADKYIVIGTDTWGVGQSITQGIAEQFAGAITIDFRNAYYNAFVDWLERITYTNRVGIPDDWFDEFYQHIHKCYLPDSPLRMEQYPKPCAGLNGDEEVITEDKIKEYAPRLTNIAATYAMGNGLSKLFREYGCADRSFASCMASIKDARDVLFQYTLDQTWNINRGQVDPKEEFNMEIGDDRYWNIGYNIYSFGVDNLYYQIGSYSTGNGFKFNEAGNYDSRREGLTSQCPKDKFCDCALKDGQTEQQVDNTTQPKYMRDHEPRNYFMYDEDTGEQVYDWPIWAIATAVLSCIGLVVGLVLFFYFLIFYPVRGGTTILGFMMMLGLFGIYATNFAFFKPAAEDTCAARKFLMGVVYTVVFAPLFVKAVDNWRFKDSEYSPKRYLGLTNPCSLVLIALGIILIQCIIPVEWLILRNPTASMMADSTYQHDWMWCDPHDFYDISLVLSMSFVVFLVILTAIFAALAWDSESNYYESRWIFVSCVCTAGCLMVWMVVSTNAGPPYRDPAVAIANFVNATALLIFIPIRKLVLLVQFSSEEEKAKTMPSDDVDPNNELYSTVYTNQMYQPDVFEPELSKQGSEPGY